MKVEKERVGTGAHEHGCLIESVRVPGHFQRAPYERYPVRKCWGFFRLKAPIVQALESEAEGCK